MTPFIVADDAEAVFVERLDLLRREPQLGVELDAEGVLRPGYMSRFRGRHRSPGASTYGQILRSG